MQTKDNAIGIKMINVFIYCEHSPRRDLNNCIIRYLGLYRYHFLTASLAQIFDETNLFS